MLQRRGFLGLLGAIAAGAVLDPERALWVPGAKTISIPAPPPVFTIASQLSCAFAVGDVITFGQDPTPWIITAINPGGPVYAELIPAPGRRAHYSSRMSMGKAMLPLHATCFQSAVLIDPRFRNRPFVRGAPRAPLPARRT